MPMSALNTGGGMKRMLGGMPHILSVAHGPGRIAFSRDATGEVVVLPLHPSMELDVREHAFLAGTHSLTYSFVRIKGLANVLHGGGGMYMDRFVTQNEPGLLLLHGYGNVFQKTLQPGEKILVEPGGFLYKDSTVTMNTVKQNDQDRADGRPQHVPGRDDRPRPGRHPVHVRPPRLRVGGPTCRCHLPRAPTPARTAGWPATAAGRDLPALRRAGRRPAARLGLRLDRAAADPGHGPDPVRPVHLPDQRHLRAGRRDGAARRRLGLLLPPRAAAHRAPGPASTTCRCRAAGSGCGPGCR